MKEPNVARLMANVTMTEKTLLRADPPQAASPIPEQASDTLRCPVDHPRRGVGPDYLRAAPTDASHLPDGTMNYEGFFRRQLHELHMQGNYRVFCDLER